MWVTMVITIQVCYVGNSLVHYNRSAIVLSYVDRSCMEMQCI
jgi:hypothetical protein